MSATEELRRLLDERGVEWAYSDGTVSYADNGRWFHAWAYNDGAMCVSMGYLTPEQAIAATLGGGENRISGRLRGIASDMRNIGASSMTPHELFAYWAREVDKAADLAATLGAGERGTCHGESDLSEWVCSECQCWIPLGLTPENIGHTSEWRYCPHCGREVKGGAK